MINTYDLYLQELDRLSQLYPHINSVILEEHAWYEVKQVLEECYA